MEETIPTAAGLSSFNLLDEQLFFAGIAFEPGMMPLKAGNQTTAPQVEAVV